MRLMAVMRTGRQGGPEKCIILYYTKYRIIHLNELRQPSLLDT